MSEPLDLLCDFIGLSRGYRDGLGFWRDTAPEHRRAILAGLGLDVGDESAVAATLGALTDAVARRVLPAYLVARAGPDETLVPVTLPPEIEDASWRLDLEDGGMRQGAIADGLRLSDLPLGYHRLSLPALDAATMLIVAPDSCHVPAPLAAGGRVWGVAVQLYTLRSARNWGIGDYTDLAAVARLAAMAGADVLGVNPFHARSLVRPDDCSPYSPVSRLCLDTLAIDVEALPELALSPVLTALIARPAFQARLAALRAAPLVDYAGVAAVKRAILRRLHDVFLTEATAARRAAYERFVADGGAGLAAYAAFEAIRGVADEAAGPTAWWDWPAPLRTRDPAALGDGALAAETGFQLWLQFIADEQLAAAAAAAKAAGMRIGLYRDLAVAAAGDGAEAWAIPALGTGVTVGAPPDPMSRQGQNWGMPAPDPRGLAESGFASFIALLRANMRYAGALRIDHVMALMRLFVIPPGESGAHGAYLAYPFAALCAVVALESHRRGCLVIGEDLGAVPDGFRERMAELAILAYKVLGFERYPDQALRAPADYPIRSLAMAATHDLPTLAGHWMGRDLAVFERLGQLADPAEAWAERARDRRRWLTLLDWQQIPPTPRPDPDAGGPPPPALIDATHRVIAIGASMIVMAQLDDILCETEAVNVPGTWGGQYPNWRRKLALDLDSHEFLRRFTEATAVLAAARPRAE
jgi:(1->4)-alpha-D-glucan 1-alpha-D-glucosylmutase